VAPAERSPRVAAVAEALGLGDLLERRPAQLSGGERQRTALARAIVRQPKAFLFDEPLSNLDAALRAGMRAELAALHRRLGVTALYVTHDQTEAMTLGHRIAVLRAGRLEQVGTPAEVYARPATVFVATFVGNPGMNVLGVRAYARTGVRAPDGAAQIGFRPEDARIAAVDGALLKGRVELVEPLGPETLVHLQLEGDGRAVLRARSQPVPHLDELVGITVAPEMLHRFDADGRRCP
jgi:ABC-type sugar transport system ATPase subunit